MTRILVGFVAALAYSSVLFHVSQVFAIPFDVCAAVDAAGLVVLAVILAIQWKTAPPCIDGPKDKQARVILLLTGIFCAATALFSHRPDSDDFNYIPNAVFYLNNAHARLDFGIHYLYAGGKPIVTYLFGIAGPYELLQSVISHFLNINYLTVYYLWSPPIISFFMPVALFLLLTKFIDDPLEASLATLLTFGVLMLLGETHRTFGNFFFNRSFQGKTLLLTIGLPLFSWSSISYLRDKIYSHGWFLFVLVVAMVGASTSSLLLLPVLAFLLWGAFKYSGNDFQLTRRDGLYFLTLSYIALYALIIKVGLAGVPSSNGNLLSENYPANFWGQMDFFVNRRWPLTPIVLSLATLSSLYFLRSEKRRLISGWILILIVVFLNPLTASWWLTHIVPRTLFWRIFYLFPFPLTLGISISAALSRLGLSSSRRIGVATLVFAVLLSLSIVSPSSPFHNSRAELAWPSYQLNPALLREGKGIIDAAPDGPMLIPDEQLAGVVTCLSGSHPQIYVRKMDMLLRLASDATLVEQITLRNDAVRCLRGGDTHLEPLEKLLNQYPELRSLVMDQTLYSASASLQKWLNENGFVNQTRLDRRIVFWR